jgi:hypothetical protein
MLPPIRYPLPMLVALVLLGLLLWRGEAWTRSLRAALTARLSRAVEGPPLPHSDRPQIVAGPITRRALLLHDDVPVADRPGGPLLETIRRRMFVDVYDVWPLSGDPTHYRVGNRRPLGWVNAADLLPWNTRLVIRRNGASPSLPVLGQSTDAVEVAVWDDDQPWSALGRREWIRASNLTPPSWGVWLSRDELLALLRRTLALAGGRAETREKLHFRAVLGRIHDDRPLSDEDLQAARAVLPHPAMVIASGSPNEASEHLARINEEWAPEVSWGGLSFRFIPLEALPPE